MSESVSDLRPVQPTRDPDVMEARMEGSSIRSTPPTMDDQPTIITGRSPLVPPSLSDSTLRILEGRILPGDRLGHFELIEFVGGGGMGRVFRALDSQLGRTVAIKILSPEQASDPDALQRFRNEAESSARLDHDNIARVFYLGEDRGLHFIVFEFIEGVNVRNLIESKGPLPLAEAVSYTLQVAEALTHANARAVVHRDIKPSNVLIAPDGRVKLIDMGLARLRHADPAVADLTASGVTLGTFDYISPEQARDPRDADIRSDIYSLGCTLFYMLAGQPPFPEGTVLQKLLQHQGDQPPEIRQFRPEAPAHLSEILQKMMAKDPRHRYANPTELVNELLLLAEEIGLRPMSLTSRIWLMPQERTVSFVQRHLPWMAPVAALFGIVILLDQFWSAPPAIEEPSTSVASASDSTHLSTPPTSSKSVRKQKLTSSAEELPRKETTTLTEETSLDDKRIEKSPTIDRSNSLFTGTDPEGEIRLKNQFTSNWEKFGEKRPGAIGTASPWGLAFSPDRGEIPATEISPSLTTSHEATPNTEILPKQASLLIVTNSPVGSEQFSTLAAACAAARNGDVIELRYNGPREERPLKIPNLRITLRAGSGYQPVILFRPSDADPIQYPHSMFTLAGGQLTLVNLEVELRVPRSVPADNWSLVETYGGETLRMEHCALTVSNASQAMASYHQDVAFLRVRSAPDLDKTVAGEPTATPLATIDLVDCIARGEADFLRVEEIQPVHLKWDNGLLAIAGRLLAAEGSQIAPKLDEMLRIELQNVTGDMRGGLCRLSSTEMNPHQLAVQFVSNNCILRTSPGVELIVQEGAASVESFRQRFIWNGDRTYYEDVNVFWTVRSTLEPDAAVDVMKFDDWTAYWGPSRENKPSTEQLFWRHSPNGNQPLHNRGPTDYTLEDPTFGDASAGAPGCRIDRLPQLPFPWEGKSRGSESASGRMLGD